MYRHARQRTEKNEQETGKKITEYENTDWKCVELTNQPQLTVAIGRPKLPVFRHGDEITTFLIRFERVAELLNFRRDSFAVRLGSLLSGRAIDVYASFSPEITGDYGRLKLALLTAFNKTSDGYR